MTTKTIENFAGADIIDVRDIIARVEELRKEKEEFEADVTNMGSWEYEEGSHELESLESLLSDLCGSGGDEQWEGDWYPVTLIKKSYFEESMDEMVADCYDMPKNLPSFMTVTLDYEMLKQDYTECEFDGETYYYR